VSNYVVGLEWIESASSVLKRAREFMGVARIRQKAVNEGKPRSPQLLAVRGRV
jgi:hypothetical protein